jgi:hypothetical protein
MSAAENLSCLQILLNVYDLHDSNRVLHGMGVGLYHTGVEVKGYEFSFSSVGVVRTRPRLPEFGVFREQIVIGTYSEGMNGIYTIISTLRNATFQPGAYNPTGLNCNHFSDAFCVAAVGQHIPSWINMAASIGSGILGTQSYGSAGSGGKGSGDALPALGVVKPPADPVMATQPAQGLQMQSTEAEIAAAQEATLVSTLFGWMGWGSSDGTAKGTNGTLHAAPTGAAPGSRSAPTSSKPPNAGAKKELTEKQKEMLARMKH